MEHFIGPAAHQRHQCRLHQSWYCAACKYIYMHASVECYFPAMFFCVTSQFFFTDECCGAWCPMCLVAALMTTSFSARAWMITSCMHAGTVYLLNDTITKVKLPRGTTEILAKILGCYKAKHLPSQQRDVSTARGFS